MWLYAVPSDLLHLTFKVVPEDANKHASTVPDGYTRPSLACMTPTTSLVTENGNPVMLKSPAPVPEEPTKYPETVTS